MAYKQKRRSKTRSSYSKGRSTRGRSYSRGGSRSRSKSRSGNRSGRAQTVRVVIEQVAPQAVGPDGHLQQDSRTKVAKF